MAEDKNTAREKPGTKTAHPPKPGQLYDIPNVLGAFSTDELQQKYNPAYSLRDDLYKTIKAKTCTTTINNIVREINHGTGEELVLKLQEIGKQNILLLNYILPTECVKAIMAYLPKQPPQQENRSI
ncbi:MAG: hypothetical protein QXR48_04475 [Candidatus Woesearchaeota archaeon]